MTSFRSWIRRGVSTSSPPRVRADPSRALLAATDVESPRVKGFHHCECDVVVDVYGRCITTKDTDEHEDDNDEHDDVTQPTDPAVDRRGTFRRKKHLADIDTAAMITDGCNGLDD